MPNVKRDPIRAKILRFLTPEERLEGLTLEQRLAGLTPEERLVALAPATRLAGLAPDQQILALSDDVLRGFSEEYVRSLPRRVQQTIRKRLATPR